jgi:hypothetical protein
MAPTDVSVYGVGAHNANNADNADNADNANNALKEELERGN